MHLVWVLALAFTVVTGCREAVETDVSNASSRRRARHLLSFDRS